MNRPLLRAALLLALLLPALPAADASAAAPSWLPGFPLRAGRTVILRWAPVPNAIGYRILKRTGEKGEFTELSRALIPLYTDADVPPEATVAYRVFAYSRKNDPGEGGAPAVLPGVKPLPAPEFTGAIGLPESISLRWSNPPGAIFFNLYRAEGKDRDYALLEPVRVDLYSDRTAQKGKTYFYRVTAIDKNNTESPRSAPVTARLREPGARGGKSGPGKGEPEDTVVRRVEPVGSFQGEQFYEFEAPFDMVPNDRGELLVLDRRSVQVFDADGTYQRRRNFPKRWSLPGGICLDRDGLLLIPFYEDGKVRKIDEEGKVAAEIAYPPTRKGEANHPNSIVVDDRGLYWILDGVRSQLIQTAGDGKALRVIGRVPGTYDRERPEETDIPGATRVQFSPHTRKLYVTLGSQCRVKVIDPSSGKVERTFGGLGKGPGLFQGIGGLAFRKDGGFYVLDHLLQVIQEFSPDFEYVATWVDLVEPDRIKLSSNLLSSVAFLEERKRFFLSSSLGNRVYIFDQAVERPFVPDPEGRRTIRTLPAPPKAAPVAPPAGAVPAAPKATPPLPGASKPSPSAPAPAPAPGAAKPAPPPAPAR